MADEGFRGCWNFLQPSGSRSLLKRIRLIIYMGRPLGCALQRPPIATGPFGFGSEVISMPHSLKSHSYTFALCNKLHCQSIAHCAASCHCFAYRISQRRESFVWHQLGLFNSFEEV